MKGMEALKKEQLYTMNDIYALPEGERAELIDGTVFIVSVVVILVTLQELQYGHFGNFAFNNLYASMCFENK